MSDIIMCAMADSAYVILSTCIIYVFSRYVL
jgi:hypothetical protein